MGHLREIRPCKGPFQLVAPAALHEHGAPEGRQPRGHGVDGAGDLDLAGFAPGLERALPDRARKAPDDERVVAPAKVEGPTELDMVAVRVRPEFLHAAKDVE